MMKQQSSYLQKWAVRFGCLWLTAASISAGAQAVASSPPRHWVATWGTALAAGKPLPGTTDATIREAIHVSLGGDTLRIKLSNEFGTTPLEIGGVHIARSNGGGVADAKSDVPVLFGGKPGTVVPAGSVAESDPVAFHLAPTADVMVSIFVAPQSAASISMHGAAMETTYIVSGDHLKAPVLDDAKAYHSFFLLKELDVDAPADAAAVVTLGDSITDGSQSTFDRNARWPDELAARLQANANTRDVGVVNEGIGGNRVVTDAPLAIIGQAAVKRFDRDVLSVSGVKYVIILEGINDVGVTAKPAQPVDSTVTASQMIAAFKQMADKAHARGIKVYGATMLPYGGAFYYSAAGEAMRETVNDWIRNGGSFDGVIDFDKLAGNSGSPRTMPAAFGSKDHLHPGDSGYKMMGDAIDLSWF